VELIREKYMKRTFEYTDDSSHKFWHIELVGARTVVSFGRVGTKGQTKAKDFPDAAAAQREFDKLIAEKLAKGYRETTAAPAPASPLREALEAALVENPDDLASHAAYADHLQDLGDPRGEFIQVQLALEDEKLPPAQRKKLRARETNLLGEHEPTWLGPLAAALKLRRLEAGARGTEPAFQFAHGWLDSLHFDVLGAFGAVALADAPGARLLRQLLIDGIEFEAGLPEEDEAFMARVEDLREDSGCMDVLTASPHLGNIRVLRIGEPIDPDFDEGIGCHCSAQGVEQFIARLPRLEELYLLAHAINVAKLFELPNLTHLRVLQLYHQDDHPFTILAKNPAAGNLTTLQCHARSYASTASRIPLGELQALCESEHLRSLRYLRLRLTDLGNDGCRALVESGMLRQLKVLDLRLGTITDEGAKVLADCPALANLDLLNLSRNALTEEGISRLSATGVHLVADAQHDEDDDEWFGIGDYE
jgi:uncharacterized protein (TIGR02996 family)